MSRALHLGVAANKTAEEPLVLFYLSYGQGIHQLEILYSVASLRHQMRDQTQPEVIILTDAPRAFEGSGCTIEYISEDIWRSWSGEKNFAHRRKICAFQHVAAIRSGALVLLDGDTWFSQSPARLARYIGPGRTVMHIEEGPFQRIPTVKFAAFSGVLRTLQQHGKLLVGPETCMWNAGVIGLHSSDRDLLVQVLDLTDLLLKFTELHIVEQFAFSWILQNQTHLSEAADVVFHYWPPYLHQPFKKQLPQLWRTVHTLPESERLAVLYRRRPRAGLLRRLRIAVRWLLQSVRLRAPRCRCSEI